MNYMKRIIAIVCGGDSSEYAVSLRSAEGVKSFFDKEKYTTYIVRIRSNDWHVTLNDGTNVPIDRKDFTFKQDGRTIFFDYAYITIHGTPGEDGLLQGYFDLIGLPYSTSGVLVEALTFNKFALNHYLRGYGIKVAESVLIRQLQATCIDEKAIENVVGMPCFVKPVAGGSSFGVSKVKKHDHLAPAIRKALLERSDVMVEACVDGIEISQGIYKTQKKTVVLPITEVVSKNEFFDYDAKYNGQVEEITPARISEETAARVSKVTEAIYDILGANGIIRIDYIISQENGEDKINMIEVNTTPGMTATSFIPQQVKAAGMTMTEVLTEIVENQFC
ncbi:MAG: D-alanine--D-alanine ligase [Bacteroidaceae bacterium]|nr:D-alanine--D-alanine ligase [Bacteroidaceae bacterium]